MVAERTLIINADDFGYDPAIDEGIVQAMQQGLVTSTTLMVNTPHSLSSARRLSTLSAGLHVNLARYPPLSPSFPSIFLSDGQLDEAFAARLPAAAVRVEVVAQLKRFEELTHRRPTHLDVHRHLHRHPQILEGISSAVTQWKLPLRSIDAPMRHDLQTRGIVTNQYFIGDAGTSAYWTWETLRSELERLPAAEGVTELMCHPGYPPTTLSSGYSEQRKVELETFTDPRGRDLLRTQGINLVNWGAIK